MIKKYLKSSHLLLGLIFLSFVIISFVAFKKPLTGNPIIYNLCAKSIANGNGPKLFFYGYAEPFFCNFHTTLETHILSIVYSKIAVSIFSSKFINFFLLFLFLCLFLRKSYRFQNYYDSIAFWLSIPLIINTFQVTDPDSNLSIFIVPIIYLHIKNRDPESLNFIFLSIMLFALIWAKEITGFLTCLIFVLSFVGESRRIFFKSIFSVTFACLLFLISYYFYCKYFNLPFSFLFEISRQLIYQSSTHGSSIQNFLVAIKGISIWLGPIFLFTFFVKTFSALKAKKLNKFIFSPDIYFSIFCLLLSLMMVIISGSFYPRYTIPFIFPAIAFITKEMLFPLKPFKKIFFKIDFLIFLLCLFFWIFFSGDVVTKSNRATLDEPQFFYKAFIIYSPLVFLIARNKILGSSFFYINRMLYVFYGVIPSLIMSYYLAASNSQNSSQIQGLKGFLNMVEFVKKKSDASTIIFADHIDLSFYLESKFIHLHDIIDDIPVSKSQRYEIDHSVYNLGNNNNYIISLRSFDNDTKMQIKDKLKLTSEPCIQKIESFTLLYPCAKN